MMRGVNPRQINQMMRRMGIEIEEIPDVEKIIIKTPGQEYIFHKPEVTIMNAKGVRTYQFTGQPEIIERSAEAPAQAPAETKLEIREEDIALVCQQTGKTKEEAKKALEETKGDIAEAIIKLSQ